MGIELTFEITFRSNYHVGAGYGKGFNVDSAILREANGVPVIRGSALAGLLRDGAYRLLQLPPLTKYDTDETLERLFGSPKRPKCWHIGSAYPKQVLPKNRDSQAVQRVRIDPRTRRAEPRKLFSQEEGVAEQVFTFTVTCSDADDATLDEAAFLVAAARNVRQLGRSRRRGLGECSIRLTDVRGVPNEGISDWQDWFLTRFNEKWMKGEPAKVLAPPERTKFWLDDKPISRYDGEPVRMRLILRLDEPLLIARRAPAGNHFEARQVIPGSVILGALANETSQRQDLNDPGPYAQFISLFLRGAVRFPTLYPADESDGHIFPTIPAPLGLLTCDILPFEGKSEGHGLYLGMEGHQKCTHANCDGKLRPINEFLPLSDEPPYTYSVRQSAELHIQVDEETGRVKQGQLYGYTVLDAGQYFVGELQCANEDAWKHLKAMTGIVEEQPMTWRLGKARSRGYGKVTAWLERLDDQKSDWIQLPLSERVQDLSQPISLTLLSDTIIQNRWGQQAVSFHEGWLEEVLGLGKVKIEDVYARSRVVDGFNNHLGLPRWRDTAITAGSVVWFTLESPPDNWRERMEQLERDGIGLRRNEGFGRIAFNHPVYDQRAALTRSSIRLEKPMRLEDKPLTDTFMAKWETKLAEALPTRLDARFGALARWLHAHSDQPPEEVLRLLHAEFDEKGVCQGFNLVRVFGEPDGALIEAIGKQEYGARSKENFFLTNDSRNTMRKICTLLKKLVEDKPYWREGIQCLASYLAAAATKKGGNE